MTNKEHLVRFPILNLKEELTNNEVSPGRHREIINFYEKHLNDTQYYCLSPTNPVRPKLNYSSTDCSRTYKCRNCDISQYFEASTVDIFDKPVKALIQKVYPKKASDFYMMNDYIIYLSKSEIDELLKNNNIIEKEIEYA